MPIPTNPNQLINKYKHQLDKLTYLVNELIYEPILAAEMGITHPLSYKEVCDIYLVSLKDNVYNEKDSNSKLKHYHIKFKNIYFDLSNEDLPMYFFKYINKNKDECSSTEITNNLDQFVREVQDEVVSAEHIINTLYKEFELYKKSLKSQIKKKPFNTSNYNSRTKKKEEEKRRLLINDEIEKLKSFSNGIPLKEIHRFLKTNFKYFLKNNIDSIILDRYFNFNKDKLEFEGSFKIPLNVIKTDDAFTELYNRFTYITIFLSKTDYYKAELNKIKDLILYDYENYQFLNKWWNKNFMEAFYIADRIIYDGLEEVNLFEIEKEYYIPSQKVPEIKIQKELLNSMFLFHQKINEVEDVLQQLR